MKGSKNFIVLGIETSCDETSAAVLLITKHQLTIKSNIVSSQIKIHAKFGGVVPEVAARHHLENILTVIDQAIKQAKITVRQINLIAVTAGPGLITSLLVGLQAAKTLSYVWHKPLLAVNHMQAHIAANFLQPLKFPALALIVSGGHTELVLVRNYQQFKKIGQTKDDAAGEAFDKVAKILGLGYPGGPAVARQAKLGDIDKFKFPRPMLKDNNFDFSFSGLKTAVLYKTAEAVIKVGLASKQTAPQLIADLCASFQQAVTDVLVSKTLKAAQCFKVKTVILAGGVAANAELRRQLGEVVQRFTRADYLVPDFSLCTDNAAMIALAAHFEYKPEEQKKYLTNWQKIRVDANWEIQN